MTNSTDIDHREAEVLLYQTNDGHTRVEVRFDGETAWLTQAGHPAGEAGRRRDQEGRP
ncbi:MAG: hypothetical protein NT151_03125 [Acidobacteria bacterium]|nr:hypothetical protein [Acidobacteriota bacterium]